MVEIRKITCKQMIKLQSKLDNLDLKIHKELSKIDSIIVKIEKINDAKKDLYSIVREEYLEELSLEAHRYEEYLEKQLEKININNNK